jgi:hypothetical protein
MYDKADQAIKFLERAEVMNGGIAFSTVDSRPYPEVSGYLIPTLLSWNQDEMAHRLARYLVSCQTSEGAWLDPVHNLPRMFDTAMVVYGLRSLSDRTYLPAINRGLAWLRPHVGEQGRIYSAVHTTQSPIYLLKVNALLGIRPEWFIERLNNEAWPYLNRRERSHYIAYAGEGLRDLGLYKELNLLLDPLKTKLHPLYSYWYKAGWVPDDPQADLCANLQLSILLARPDMFEAVERHQQEHGGIPLRDGPNDREFVTWTMKYYLDAADSFGYNDDEEFDDEEDDHAH